MAIDVGKEVFPPPGVLEGPGEQLMKLVIVGVIGVYSTVEVIFEPKPLISFMGVVVVCFLDVLKLGLMLLVLHLYVLWILSLIFR